MALNTTCKGRLATRGIVDARIQGSCIILAGTTQPPTEPGPDGTVVHSLLQAKYLESSDLT